jgi:hypothetical protein
MKQVPSSARFLLGLFFNAESEGNKQETSMKQVESSAAFVLNLAYSSTLTKEATCSSKMSMDFNGLHNVTSQKIELFIITTVRTSNPTQYSDS